MVTIIVSTMCDPARPGLTYKIEMPDHQFEGWWDQMVVKQLINEEFVLTQSVHNHTFEGANTTVTLYKTDSPGKVHLFKATLEQLIQLFQSADYEYGNVGTGKPGRPEKRVLLLTTSKDRRTKAQTVRQLLY